MDLFSFKTKVFGADRDAEKFGCVASNKSKENQTKIIGIEKNQNTKQKESNKSTS